MAEAVEIWMKFGFRLCTQVSVRIRYKRGDSYASQDQEECKPSSLLKQIAAVYIMNALHFRSVSFALTFLYRVGKVSAFIALQLVLL